jgi:hypothetical protein
MCPNEIWLNPKTQVPKDRSGDDIARQIRDLLDPWCDSTSKDHEARTPEEVENVDRVARLVKSVSRHDT